jgi:uncharacterized membrane protein YdfJ with MMPL/SSD domain
MNNPPDLNTAGPARRLFWVAGLTAAVALALAPLSFHVERRLDTAVRLERTAGLITSAAAIMIVVFAGFTLGDFLVIKMLGFTLAVAVLIDATLVRIVIGPALLSLAGDWNWWPGGLAGANARAPRETMG